MLAAQSPNLISDDLERLKLGESMEISIHYEPKLLQEVLKTLREGPYAWQVLESSADKWRFSISRIKEPAIDPETGKPEGCCGSCGAHSDATRP